MTSRTPHRVRLPEELLGLFLTPDGRLPAFAQRRLDGLIDKSKAEDLTRPEERELAEMLEYVDQKSLLLLQHAAAREHKRPRPRSKAHSSLSA